MGRKSTKPAPQERGKTKASRNRIPGRPAAQSGIASLTFGTSRWAALLAAGLIALATLAAYSNTFRNPFIFDDKDAILENPTIRSLWPIGPVLSPPANGEAVQRRPVVNLSLAINYAISGQAVWSYHALNLLAHLLAALLLFGIVRRTLLLPNLRDRWCRAATPLALAVALLWAVHPLLTEAVTYVVQRTEVLAGLFYLLTLYCVIRGAGSARCWGWYAGAVAACALAMGSKEVAVSAPLVVLLYDRVFLSPSWREVFRCRWGLYVGLAATWAVILILLSQGSEGAAVFTVLQSAEAVRMIGEGHRTIDYTLAQFGVIAHYLQLCFWPHPLVLDYGFYVPQTAWQIVPYALLIGGLLAATVAAFRSQPWLGFLGVWFFAILAPSSSVVPLFQQIAAEKRMYLPLAAVVTGVVIGGYLAGRWLVDRGVVSLRASHVVGSCLIVFVAVTFAALTLHRNTDYRSNLAIWDDIVAKVPYNERAQNNFAAELMEVGRDDDAIAHCHTALELRPDFAEAHCNLGKAFMKLKRREEAIDQYQEALKIQPEFATAHNNLGIALIENGQVDEAIAHFRKAVQAKPNFAEAHNALANALAGQGKLDEAIVHYQRALKFKPDYLASYNNLGNILTALGRVDEAIALYQKALVSNPNYAPAHCNLGLCLAAVGRADEAITQYQMALELNPEFPEACYNLGNAFVGQARFREAKAQYRNALTLKPDWVVAYNQLARLSAACRDAAIRNGVEAVALAQQAVTLSGGRVPTILDTLAAAYAEAGRFPEAIRTAQRAADLAAQQNDAALVEAIKSHLRLYEAGTPLRGM